jgi:hypothetical protein
MLKFDNDKNSERSATIIAIVVRFILIIFLLSLFLFGCGRKNVTTQSITYPINREVVIDIPFVDSFGQQQTIQHKIFIDSIKIDEKVVQTNSPKKIVDRSRTKINIRTDNSTDLRRADVGTINQLDVAISDSATNVSILPNQVVDKVSNNTNNKRTNFLNRIKNFILIVLGLVVLLIVYRLVK